MNPTRGGDEGGDYASQMLETYKHKVSGPILDRIDLWLSVPHVDYDTLTKERVTEAQTKETDEVRTAVLRARAIQRKRFDGLGITANAEMSARTIDERIELTEGVRTLLKQSAQKLNLSPRSYHRLVKVARTIADLEGVDTIEKHHVLEALQYRMK